MGSNLRQFGEECPGNTKMLNLRATESVGFTIEIEIEISDTFF